MPYIVRQCVEEIERRGMEEVGIYRVSGVATDIQALKAAFDVSKYLCLHPRNLHQLPVRTQALRGRAACTKRTILTLAVCLTKVVQQCK